MKILENVPPFFWWIVITGVLSAVQQTMDKFGGPENNWWAFLITSVIGALLSALPVLSKQPTSGPEGAAGAPAPKSSRSALAIWFMGK